MAVDSDIDAITPVEGTPLDPPPKRLTMFKKLDAWCDKLNDSVAKSFVGKRFRLEGSGHVCAYHSHDRRDSGGYARAAETVLHQSSCMSNKTPKLCLSLFAILYMP